MKYSFTNMKFIDATEAFEILYDRINKKGDNDVENGTKRILNVGFYIDKPWRRIIETDFRKFSPVYARREWEWYLSQNRSVEQLKKYAPIWDRMHRGDNIVNSNYGYQWNRNDQLNKAIKLLELSPGTRRAWISLYDGKEIDQYEHDTVCTLAIGFTIEEDRLNMTVLMRSNDLWYGFCNDQYCFSMLQEKVALRLECRIGWYYHYAADMHLYNNKLNKNGSR